MERRHLLGAIDGLTAAILFGASAPLAKMLLGSIGPLPLAALLYLGAGLALLLAGVVRGTAARREAGLRRQDVPLLFGVILCGGIIGPLLLLWGLTRLPSLSGALLLNLEAPFTVLLAVGLFREHLGWRGGIAVALVVAGASLIGIRPVDLRGGGPGALAIAGACLSWGIDNNLTQRLSLRDPVAVMRVKTLAAGAVNLILSVLVKSAVPSSGVALRALAAGALCYGASLVLHVHALRALGAARQAAFFSAAPFAGALLSIPLLGDRPTPIDIAAGAAMVFGIVLLLRSEHNHRHTHESLSHDHKHIHDQHHQHTHGSSPIDEPHAHPHQHDPIEHAHPHVSDIHHRHPH